MLISLLSTIFTSIISGGATGILGVAVQRYFDLQKVKSDAGLTKAKYEHELALKKADVEIMAQEWSGRMRVAEVEAEGKEAVADANAFAASFNEPALYSAAIVPPTKPHGAFVFLDVVRGLVRPLLTIYLCIVTTLVYFEARALIVEPLPADNALELVKMIVGTVLYLTTSCVLWWFGTRNKQPAPMVQQ